MAVDTAPQIEFSKELESFIEEWKPKPGNLIMVLHRVQEEFGYIPREAAIKVSQLLDTPLAKIYGVITFYHFFKLDKPGKYNIQVCMGTACYLKGGEDLINEMENLLGIGVNEVTDDGLFSIESVRCVGCCGLAPVMIVDGEVFGKVTKDELPEIIANYRKQG
ncbi:MAG: NAD(P)H-dependent oxidoreductase subunit E [Spirochaetales bacterium]|nr:NAD(P)H-dependent oxidoreductase subunit E [Spirochaetales bacterium]